MLLIETAWNSLEQSKSLFLLLLYNKTQTQQFLFFIVKENTHRALCHYLVLVALNISH